MIEISIDIDDWNLLNIASCITYDEPLYNKLHDKHIKVGDVLHLSVEDTNIWCELLVDEIEYGDGTIWTKWLNDNG